MAHLTAAEFGEAVQALAAHFGLERLRDRLARMNAFTSRRGLGTPSALADRLHLLTGGLRRQTPATFAVSALWNEMVGARLAEDESVVPGKEDALDAALAAYRDALAGATGPDVARLDMLLKAVPAVAERLRRAHPTGSADAAPGS